MSTPDALTMSGIDKAFPGVQALDNASLSVRSGEIHGLVGENGAGKSTIIKVLAGVYSADGGTTEINGAELQSITPQSVNDAGIRFIHQEVSLVPHFTVAESVFMGQEVSGPFGLDTRGMRKRAEEFLAESLGAEIQGTTLIRDLSVAQRKLVQIARALIDGQAKLVVFDEPTAVLAAEDIEQLFTAIRGLRDRGIAMVYVSHYLSEIESICDRVTVFRNGTDVGVLDLANDLDAGEVDTGDIISLMVGREISDLYPDRQAGLGEPLLQVSELSDGSSFSDVSFDVKAGEIVGLAGIIGSGRESLVDSIYGIQRSKGTIRINGQDVSVRQPADAVKAGLVLVPRDRRNDGLVLNMSVADNINVATLEEVSAAGWIKRGKAAARSDELVERLDIRPPRSSTIVQFLSGGNQQKVVLARWLATGSEVYVLDDPTVGVDVGARSEIYKLIGGLADDGAGVLVSSNDLGELLGLCDRVLVMVRGELVANTPVDELTLESLLAVTTGASSASGLLDSEVAS